MIQEPDHYHDLDAVQSAAWGLLVRGVNDRRSPAHHPAVATVSPSGMPQVRTVVLRGCDPRTRTLTFHTDARSAKVEALAAHPFAVVHVYGPKQKIQLRLDARVTLHAADDIAAGRWERTRDMSRQCYRVTTAPGSAIESVEAIDFDRSHAESGYAHFVVVQARVTALEWLYLSAQGHRRARFEYARADTSATWLVP